MSKWRYRGAFALSVAVTTAWVIVYAATGKALVSFYEWIFR